MRHAIRTASAALSATALLLCTTAIPASASTDVANGTFYTSDLLNGYGELNDPTIGACYTLTPLILSASNQTDATAVVFSDPYCTVAGFRVDPGNTTTFQLWSVRFTRS
ncbi:hypothetical protein AB0I60_02645 [Actinosynnema sp. NPDC050436]|uniref:hypothetical protein n=1 Tax=Actinosynnema sp. NPDC050436 TaxID=3155659 RepID=UPI0033D257F2